MPYPSTVKLLKHYYKKATVFEDPVKEGGLDENIRKLLQQKDMGDYYIVPRLEGRKTQNGVTRYTINYDNKFYKHPSLIPREEGPPTEEDAIRAEAYRYL